MRLADIAYAGALLCAAIWPALYSTPSAAPIASAASPEWAQEQWLLPGTSAVRWRLSSLEERFARQFPGHIARFKDERHEWIVRVVEKPTRMLHPASDCFRALGYSVGEAHVHGDTRGENWRCFTAERNGRRVRVCERIFDARGGRWTDASSWYWSALLAGASGAGGPWWAITRVENAGE
jgi:hypothetical protein